MPVILTRRTTSGVFFSVTLPLQMSSTDTRALRFVDFLLAKSNLAAGLPMKTLFAVVTTSLLLAAAFAPRFTAQPYEHAAFGEMRWRAVGPFRGGRTKAITGVPGE